MDAKVKTSHSVFPLVIIAAISLGVYSSTLFNGFVYDDNHILLSNVWIRGFSHAPDILSSSLMSFDEARSASNTYRPFLFFLFMAEHYVFGFKPWGFHLVNIILHAANAVLVFYLASFLFKGGGYNPDKPVPAAPPVFAGLVFSLHTINTEAVNWVSAQAELTYAFFTLASFNLYLRAASGRLSARLALSAFLFFLALFFKETAAALIPIIFLYELSARGRGLLKAWRGYLLFLTAAFAFMALRTYAVGGIMRHKQAELSLWGAILNMFPLIAGYFKKLVYPSGLNILYEFHPAREVFDLRVIAGLIILILFLLAAVSFRKNKPVFIALLASSMPLLPVLYIPALSSAAFADRYLYLPSAGFALLLAYALSRAMDKGRAEGFAAIFISVLLLFSYSAASIERGSVWRDDYALWGDALKKSPNNPNVHYNFAWASHGKGDLENAAAHYVETIRLDRGASDAHYNLGVIYAYQNRPIEAAFEFREALRINPGYKEAGERLSQIEESGGIE